MAIESVSGRGSCSLCGCFKRITNGLRNITKEVAKHALYEMQEYVGGYKAHEERYSQFMTDSVRRVADAGMLSNDDLSRFCTIWTKFEWFQRNDGVEEFTPFPEDEMAAHPRQIKLVTDKRGLFCIVPMHVQSRDDSRTVYSALSIVRRIDRGRISLQVSRVAEHRINPSQLDENELRALSGQAGFTRKIGSNRILGSNPYVIRFPSDNKLKKDALMITKLCNQTLEQYVDEVAETGTVEKCKSVIRMFRDVCEGMELLHQNNVSHILTLENIGVKVKDGELHAVVSGLEDMNLNGDQQEDVDQFQAIFREVLGNRWMKLALKASDITSLNSLTHRHVTRFSKPQTFTSLRESLDRVIERWPLSTICEY